MTIIAWDGQRLAADRLSNGGNTKSYTVKIQRINGQLVGAAGRGVACAAFIHWLERGAKEEEFPMHEFGADECEGNGLVIKPDGQILVFENSPIPMQFLDRNYAIGSGAAYAKAAMFLGLSAEQACAVAIELDPNCGGDIDVLELHEGKPGAEVTHAGV